MIQKISPQIAIVIFLSILLFGNCQIDSPSESKKQQRTTEEIAGMRISNLKMAADYAEGSGIIIRGGVIAFQWGAPDKISEINGFLERVGKSIDSTSEASQKYDSNLLTTLEKSQTNWCNNQNGDMTAIPKDTLWNWGPNNGLIAIIPSLDIVIVETGKSFRDRGNSIYFKKVERFVAFIVDSVNCGSPYPNSPAIANIKWDSSENIIRKGVGSDNWPITWADDNDLYTAFGDGYGFAPNLQVKLSLGLGKISGNPTNFIGSNIKMHDPMQGNQKSGRKASGILMVNDILFLWVRNANDIGEGSQLAWSTDKGQSLKWSNWIFNQLGYCTFINFGKNNQGARDNYIYSVSHNSQSAYRRADSFIMLRVPVDKVLIRSAYEFFKGLDEKNRPVWTSDIEERGAVFEDKGRCYRSGISYNAPLRRYFWWQAKFKDGVDGRFESKSFGIFDAAEPWGPWTTVYYTENWDVATGETGGFPTKWMSDNGKTMYLVFSGNDSFSVRKATMTLSSIAH